MGPYIPKRYLNEKEVSMRIRRSLSALRKDRFMGVGIPYIKLGRSVLYIEEEVDTYMQDRKIKTRSI